MTEGMVTAEPAYILLAAHGHPDAHEAVRAVTLEAQQTGKPMGEILFASEELAPWLARFTDAQRAIIGDPSTYTGISAEKARSVCDFWAERLSL